MSAASRAISGLTFGRIISQTNISRDIVTNNLAKVFAPGGFTNEAFNREACVRPWSLLKMIEGARSSAFHKSPSDEGSFMDADKLYQNYLFFIASTSMTISPELYKISTMKAPIECVVKLEYFGNSTFKLRTSIYNQTENFNILLCDNETQTVCVDIATRKPAALPDWWREKHTKVKGKALKLEQLTVPEGVEFQQHSIQVLPSDVDPYMHLNWSNVVRFCHDSFVYSELQKHGKEDAGKAFRNMKQFSVSYLKEASLGDNINIRFWQSAANSDTYHFQLMNGSDIVSECSVQFFK